jgi:hypothetical protein
LDDWSFFSTKLALALVGKTEEGKIGKHELVLLF